MLKAAYSSQFKKDYRLMQRRSFNMDALIYVMKELESEKNLELTYKDHPLTGGYKGYRECHIKPDWLLIYQLGDGVIVFERTGSHSDLF